MKSFWEYLNESQVYSANLDSVSGFKNTLSGRGNNKAVVLMNDKGEFGFLGDEKTPYTPVGGRIALSDLYKDSPQIFTFKKYSYGDGVTIKRGRKI